MNKYYVSTKRKHTQQPVFYSSDSYEECEKAIDEMEQEDLDNGEYEPDYYSIYDSETDHIV